MKIIREKVENKVLLELSRYTRKYCLLLVMLVNITLGQAQSGADSLMPAPVYFGRIRIQSDRAQTELMHRAKDFVPCVANKTNYEQLCQYLLNIPQAQGYYYPVLSLQEVVPCQNADSLYLNPCFYLDWGEQVIIDTFMFEAADQIASRFFKRELSSFRHQVYSSSMVANIRASLNRYDFFSVGQQSEIVKTRQGHYGLLMQIKTLPANEFSGVLGYVPSKIEAAGYFTGQLNLRLSNLAGIGRKLAIHWSKVNRYSQELRLSYFEPWIGHSNFFGEAQFEQTLRDTLVVIRQFQAGIGRRVFGSARLQGNVVSKTTIPTPGGRNLLDLHASNALLAGIDFSMDQRDNKRNPRRGYRYDLSGRYGYRNEARLKSRLSQLEIDVQGLWSLYKQSVLALQMVYKQKWLPGRKLDYSEHFWFGGANTLRGYPEDFLHGSGIGWISAEVRWLFGHSSRIFLFFDQGYYQRQAQLLSQAHYPCGYGLGIQLDSRMGIIGLDYAFGENDSFTTAKIHVHLENRF